MASRVLVIIFIRIDLHFSSSLCFRSPSSASQFGSWSSPSLGSDRDSRIVHGVNSCSFHWIGSWSPLMDRVVLFRSGRIVNTHWFGSCHLAEIVTCSFRRIVTPRLEWIVEDRDGSGHLFVKQHGSSREVWIRSDRHHRIVDVACDPIRISA